ncbi:MAG: hypothetical protein WKG00_10190 [Polyangiaceae bacterium]
MTCPACSAEVVDELWFQWGFCGGRAPRPESTYRLGESIRWAHCPDGSTPAWTHFADDHGAGGGNFGTPDIRDLIVRDSGQVWLREPCPKCGADLQAGALEIRDGRIERAWLAVPGELAGDSDYWQRADVGLRPLPFGDEPMAVSECRPSVRRP